MAHNTHKRYGRAQSILNTQLIFRGKKCFAPMNTGPVTFSSRMLANCVIYELICP